MKDGGGFRIDNIRKLVLRNTTLIQNNKATNSGGGISFVCPEDDFGEGQCELLIADTIITANEANEGGGIKYHDVFPTFSNCQIQNNTAFLYGNDFASFATQIVQFVPHTSAYPDDDQLEGQTDFDYFTTYFETRSDLTPIQMIRNPLIAEPPVTNEMVSFAVNSRIPSI
jgi:predicted outer membrane repeat protein